MVGLSTVIGFTVGCLAARIVRYLGLNNTTPSTKKDRCDASVDTADLYVSSWPEEQHLDSMHSQASTAGSEAAPADVSSVGTSASDTCTANEFAERDRRRPAAPGIEAISVDDSLPPVAHCHNTTAKHLGTTVDDEAVVNSLFVPDR